VHYFLLSNMRFGRRVLDFITLNNECVQKMIDVGMIDVVLSLGSSLV